MNQAAHIRFRKSLLPGVEIKTCNGSPHDYAPHVHEELTIGYIREGSTELTVEDRIIRYGKGDGVLIPPFVSHTCSPHDSVHWEYIILYVVPEYYGNRIAFLQPQRIPQPRVSELIGFLDNMLTEPDPDLLESMLIELLFEFGKDICGLPVEKGVLMDVQRHIIKHVSEPFRLESLEKRFNLNKFTLIRNFKRLYTATPAAFHMQCRVAEAKKMLGAGADIFDICDVLGFYDQSHFIREFKKRNGITPAAYLLQLQR